MVINLSLAVHALLKRMKTALDISKVKLATVVDGDQKAPFSIATTPIQKCYFLPQCFDCFHIV